MRNLFLLILLLQTLSVSAQRVELSHKHGFYDKPFSLSLSVDADQPENYSIRYTTDGSKPTSESYSYVRPLTVSQNLILRAAAVDAYGRMGEVSTASYLFAADVMSQPASPSGYPSSWGKYCEISGTAKADYEMDPEMTGNKSLSQKIYDGLTAIPTLSIVTDKDNFFSHQNDSLLGGIYIYTGTPVGDGTGRNWVRPVSVELFGGTDKHDLTVDCAVKIHGGHSRLPEKTPKHSLRLMFKGDYGPSKLNYRIFGKEGPKKFNQLVLRSMFGNTWLHWDASQRRRAQYERDLWARTTQHLMGHPSSRGLYVHLFINGLYWGLYNIAERIDDYYCSSNFGGEREHYDVIKVEEDHASHKILASEGDMAKWKEMAALVEQAASSDEAFYRLIGCDADGQPDEEVEPLLDIDNFIDFMLINQYAGNTDWDHHNWLAFRNREAADRGFRFICWDSEVIFEGLNVNNLSLNNSGAPSHFFTRLVNNRNFLQRYISHAYRHLRGENGLLTPKRVREVWDSLYQVIALPLYDEAARWGDYRRDVHPYQSKGELYSVDEHFMTERSRLHDTYFAQRTDVFINQLKEKGWYYTVEPPLFRLNGSTENLSDVLAYGDVLTFRASYITYYTFDGTDPVVWNGTTGSIAPTAMRYSGKNILLGLDWTQSDVVTIKAACRSGKEWSPVTEHSFRIDQTTRILQTDMAQQPTANGIYDLAGRRLADDTDLPPGIYIINGKKVLMK